MCLKRLECWLKKVSKRLQARIGPFLSLQDLSSKSAVIYAANAAYYLKIDKKRTYHSISRLKMKRRAPSCPLISLPSNLKKPFYSQFHLFSHLECVPNTRQKISCRIAGLTRQKLIPLQTMFLGIYLHLNFSLL